MEKQRILKLALQSLEQEKARIETEITQIRSQLKPTAKKRTGRRVTAKRKKEASARMKRYWKARKAAQSKSK